MSNPPAPKAPPPHNLDEEDLRPTHSKDGVDLTLIRWMLSLTPEQRLDNLQQHSNAMWELRNAFQSS